MITTWSPNSDDIEDKKNIDLLYDLCKKNEVEKIRKIIPFIGNKNIINQIQTSTGSTCLHVACYYGHRDVVEILLNYGALRSIRNLRHDLTPYEEAHTDSIKQLFLEQRKLFSNNDYDYIQWSLVGDDLLDKRRSFRQIIDVYKTYDNHTLISKLIAEFIHYYLNDYLLNLSSDTGNPEDRMTPDQIKTLEDCFRNAIEKKDYLTYFIEAYTLNSGFHKVLNRHLAMYILDYFDESKLFLPTYRLVNCLAHIVTLLIHHPDVSRYQYRGSCYRGMRITQNDLNQYQLNQHMLNCSFLSTSTDRGVAEMFAGEGEQSNMRHTPKGDRALQYSCVCQYSIKQSATAIDIQKLSINSDENEVLILPFTVFKVVSIKWNDLEKPETKISIEIELEECDDPNDHRIAPVSTKIELEECDDPDDHPKQLEKIKKIKRFKYCSIKGLLLQLVLLFLLIITIFIVFKNTKRFNKTGTHGTTSIPQLLQAPTCKDGMKNLDETDVDCGGETCKRKCSPQQGCDSNSDCTSNNCNTTTKKCLTPTCTDGVKNQDEIDVDCGGTVCASKCLPQEGCRSSSDCTSNNCDITTKKCQTPTCTDGVKNQDETDVDCGGATCSKKCLYQQGCRSSADCACSKCDTTTKKCLKSKFNKWKQNAITVAGGNGEGQELNQLNEPHGIFIDKNKNIFIADRWNHRIVEWKYNAKKGQIIAGGNGKGNQMNQLNNPTNAIVDQQNHSIIIADHGNRRVIQWLNQNQQILIENIYCLDLVMDKHGFLYVSDFKKNEVRRWKIGEYNNDGIVVAGPDVEEDEFDHLNSLGSFFVDEDQSVYVSDDDINRVIKWRKDAKEGRVVAGGNSDGENLNQLYSPQGVIVDDLGQIYVADSGNHRVMRWCEGKKEGEIVVGGNGQGNQSNQLNYPIGLSFDDEGNLYVVDYNNHRIQKFKIIL
ncbi:unnamed protein product [Adineta steineri]|uniref:NAD(P)(+)--arginine ADP-ribosyltransferase n=1 Tax=Adineta steineri TaxID=433720 RepID=A0A814G503_9BILA|nr:unnamed protein product [Adineta steineri]CAF1563324.1 unnamed protein product [Adineta steineri]